MAFPEFTAEESLCKTRWRYRMGPTFGVVTGGGEALPQQGGIGFCQARCAPNDFSCLFDCLRGGGRGGGDGGDQCTVTFTCRPDPTSSTGWREYGCTLCPGVGRRCGLGTDECAAPGCGPVAGLPGCTCTCAPDCSRTCTERCFRYGLPTTDGGVINYTRPCTP
jgi:hypothetical protein